MSISKPIEIKGVRKTYGRVVALDSVDVSVRPGEFLTLLGPSGSGKSTLLMVLAGFVVPDSGSVKIDSREIITMPPHKRDIGLVFQNYALFPHMTVSQNIAFPLRYRNVNKADANRRVEGALAMVRLMGYGERLISELSGGQKQRVALARAFVFNPAILLMDEPLSALDKKLREEMQIELRQLHNKIGATTIYVTHDQREALTMSDRIAVMREGRFVQIGEPKAIYERPDNRFIADFVGDSQFIGVEIIGPGQARVEDTVFSIAHMPETRGPGHLVLRPEKVELVGTDEVHNEFNRLSCEVCNVHYQGGQLLIGVRLNSGEIVHVRRGTNESVMRNLPKPGARMVLQLHPKDSVVVAVE